MNPVPSSPDLRPIKSFFGLSIARRVNPWLDNLHPFGATRADEEIGWLSLALNPCAYEAQWHIPSYVRWSEGHDPMPVYREFDRILRTDAGLVGDFARPRILKCPQFSEDLPALLARFPKARVVVTHRNQAAVLESAVSMVASQMAFQSDEADLDTIRSEWRRKLDLRDKRIGNALAQFTGLTAHVEFDSLGADWRGEIAQVYANLGLTLTPDALRAMEREQAKAARSDHHGHADQLDRFAKGSDAC